MSIIGNPIMVGVGANPKARINVTAKAGALLNLHYKDSSIILKSYQLGAKETQHMFVVSLSERMYVIDDITNRSSVEVLVDAVAVFNVELEYKPAGALFWLGDKCAELSGGWNTMQGPYGGTPGVSFESVYLIPSNNTGGNYNEGGAKTANLINLSPYSKLYVQVDEFKAQSGTRIMLTPNNPWPTGSDRYERHFSGAGLVEFDISSYTRSLFVSFVINTGSIKVSKVWLS